MWLLKGILIGVGTFLAFSVLYIYRVLLSPIYSGTPKLPGRQPSSIDIRALQAAIETLTIQSPLWWAAFCLMVVTACACMRLFQKPY